MHYDVNRPKQFKSKDDVILALKNNPLSRDASLNMINDGIHLEFLSLEYKGVSMPIRGKWYILVNDDCDDQEKEEIIWHELLHLHLRRIFGGLFNDNGLDGEELHPIIVEEGQRLAKNPLISYYELINLISR